MPRAHQIDSDETVLNDDDYVVVDGPNRITAAKMPIKSIVALNQAGELQGAVQDRGSELADLAAAIGVISDKVTQNNTLLESANSRLGNVEGGIQLLQDRMLAAEEAITEIIEQGTPTTPPTPPTPSPDGTEITPGSGTIVTETLEIWAITAGGIVTRNEVEDPNAQNVAKAGLFTGEIYRKDEDDSAWRWTGTSWQAIQNYPGDAPAGPTNYIVAGPNIIAPDGSVVGALGANVLPGQQSLLTAVQTWWGMGMVRVCWLVPPFASYTDEQFFNTVDAYLAAGMIVIGDLYHAIGSGNPPSASITAEVDRRIDAAVARYADQPRFWFQPYNEYGGLDVVGSGAAAQFDSGKASNWVTWHRARITRVRNALANNIVIVSSLIIGADHLTDTSWNWAAGDAKPWNEKSSIIKYGPQIKLGFENVAFDVHVYNNYSNSTDTFLAFMQAAQAAGLAVVVNEIGANLAGFSTITGTQKVVTARATVTFCISVWGFSMADTNADLTTTGPNGGGDLINDAANPTNLTAFGQIVWDLAHP